MKKGEAWQTAIGLQAVDGLKPSDYLVQTAKQHIEGDITIEEAKHLIDSYYQSKTVRHEQGEERTEEADKVSARITELLTESAFSFSPVAYIGIHRKFIHWYLQVCRQIARLQYHQKGVGTRWRHGSLRPVQTICVRLWTMISSKKSVFLIKACLWRKLSSI